MRKNGLKTIAVRITQGEQERVRVLAAAERRPMANFLWWIFEQYEKRQKK